MIAHIFKIIWNNKRSNIWLLLGLLIMSLCLWLTVDYFYATIVNQRQKLGFDWHHVYNLQIGALTAESEKFDSERVSSPNASADFLTFMNRLKHHPSVESACYTIHHKHYLWMNHGTTLQADSLQTKSWYRQVSPDYFRVFKVNGAYGLSPDQLAGKANLNEIIVTENVAKKLFPDRDAVGQMVINFVGNDTVRVSAVCENQKYNEYSPHTEAMYSTLNVTEKSGYSIYDFQYMGIYIRIRPEVDKGNFMADFRKEMREQLMIGDIYLQDMRPMADIRDEHLKDYRNDVYTYITICVFLLMNVFLAILGTFWTRTQQRRGELALRVALGCRKYDLRMLLIGEGICLLTIAFIPTAVIGLNLGYGEVISSWPIPFTMGRFVVGIIIAYLLLVLTVFFGIWFPTNQVVDIEPAEALHEE